MQFPVPQFTDVEDKIIGPLTIKQFGFVFAAGIVVVLVFTSTKSVLAAIVAFLLVGVPALGIAFAKINGRPIYNLFPTILKFIFSDKILIFHKEVLSSGKNLKNAELESKGEFAQKVMTSQDSQKSLLDVEKLLSAERRAEKELVKQLK